MSFDIVNPKNTSQLLEAIKQYEGENYRFGAGCTDLLMELKKKPSEGLTVINLAQVEDELFTGLKVEDGYYRLGAMFTANEIVINQELMNNFPVLHQAAHNLASTQIRQVATIGGNLCTASPSGDIACALVALGARCIILSSSSKIRIMPVTGFFLGLRQTDLGANEVLYGIKIPKNEVPLKNIVSGFIKVGTRLSMECSVVSLAYHIQTDNEGVITHAGIAIGASAPTIRFAEKACAYLIGKEINGFTQSSKEEFASLVVSYATPITDIRATVWYRKEVLYNISKSILE